MAVMGEGLGPVTKFEDWYLEYGIDERKGCLEFRSFAPCAEGVVRKYEKFKNEMDKRVSNYSTLEKLADGEVISPKPDLPNISSGETAGIVRRIARSLVQNTPNVEVLSEFDDESVNGIFSRHILTTKIIGSDRYSNDMQQNLFASTKTAFTLGFDCVIPVLLQDAANGWHIKYDAIYYRDVFPEPGVKDVRDATSVFIRRYLSQGEVHGLIRDNAVGWDTAALKLLLQTGPGSRDRNSVDHQTAKHRQIPEGYEIITWYSNSGEAFLTFDACSRILLRVEQNKHPLKWHPVFFLVLEKDSQQPLGKSQVELLVGRQDFQDLMLNGAMKLWYRNINPSIIGYGAVNSIPNLSPGKYTQISNPNAKIEPFEVNTQTLMQYGSISNQNLGSMTQLVGALDQQMAASGTNSPMSATPQGVEAQNAVVDITTNNYQKAIESFFSHYCSYALTMYFQELASVQQVVPTADARLKLIKAGLAPEKIDAVGVLKVDFKELATEYFVRCIPGSLVEMEDEKQLRILNELFVPLSQAMPALAATQDPDMLNQAALAMQYIITKQIQLSGSDHANDLAGLWSKGDTQAVQNRDAKIAAIEATVGGLPDYEEELEVNSAGIVQLQAQIKQLTEVTGLILQKLGVDSSGSTEQSNSSGGPGLQAAPDPGTVTIASA